MESRSSAPAAGDFVPLSDFRQQTPETFFGSKPVLHLYSPNSRVVLQGSKAKSTICGLLGITPAPSHENVSAQPSASRDTNGAHTNGATEEADGESDPDVVLGNVNVFVASNKLILFSQSTSKGVEIPYTSIGIHGVSTLTAGSQPLKALYMQLNLYDTENSNSDDDIETADVSIVPFPAEAFDTRARDAFGEQHATTSTLPDDEAVQKLFEAVSECQNLHPDPHEDDDDEAPQMLGGGVGAAGMPGEGGWITSENISQFTDAEGNFTGFGSAAGDSLGPGAGTVRPREEQDEEEERFGDGEDDGEAKWQRTD